MRVRPAVVLEVSAAHWNSEEFLCQFSPAGERSVSATTSISQTAHSSIRKANQFLLVHGIPSLWNRLHAINRSKEDRSALLATVHVLWMFSYLVRGRDGFVRQASIEIMSHKRSDRSEERRARARLAQCAPHTRTPAIQSTSLADFYNIRP